MNENINDVDYKMVRDRKQSKEVRYLKISQLDYRNEIMSKLENFTDYTGCGYSNPPVMKIDGEYYISTGFYINYCNKLGKSDTTLNPIKSSKKARYNKKETPRAYNTKVVTLEELNKAYILEGSKLDKTTVLRDRINNKVIYSNGVVEIANKAGTYTPRGGRQLTVCAVIRAMIDGCDYQMVNSKHLDIHGKKPDKINFWPSQIVCKHGNLDWKDIQLESQLSNTTKQLELPLVNIAPTTVINNSEISEEDRIKCLKLALQLNDLFQKGNVDKSIKDVCGMLLGK